MKTFGELCLVWVAALMSACAVPDLPEPRKSTPSLSTDDVDVMRSVLNALVRPGPARMIRAPDRNRAVPTEPVRPILVFNRTMAVCAADPMAFAPGLPGCLVRTLFHRMEATSGLLNREATSLKLRNSEPRPIGGPLRGDVILIEALANSRDVGSVMRQFPGSVIVSFSSPAYRDGDTAVIFYRRLHARHGFLRLERSSAGWSIVGDMTEME